MIQASIERLKYLCDTLPPLLHAMDDEAFSFKAHPGEWSKKEELGHLIDSAANNHQRFVRAQFEDIPLITYHTDNWNKHNYYQHMDGRQVISFWAAYNRQLIEVIQHIPEDSLTRQCNSGDSEPHTLAFLINDYVTHMEHHLGVIVDYQ